MEMELIVLRVSVGEASNVSRLSYLYFYDTDIHFVLHDTTTTTKDRARHQHQHYIDRRYA